MNFSLRSTILSIFSLGTFLSYDLIFVSGFLFLVLSLVGTTAAAVSIEDDNKDSDFSPRLRWIFILGTIACLVYLLSMLSSWTDAG